MIFTVEQCRQHLEMWLLAEEKVAQGQSYTIGNRTLTRVNANEIQRNIEIWADRLERAQGSNSPKIIRFVPRR